VSHQSATFARMTILLRHLTAHLEALAPLAYQEEYDNAGLIVGNPDQPVTGILVSLDTTEAVVDEAIARGCNVIVAHHPIVFRGLKRFTGRTYVERTVIKAIKNDIAIYAAHTNLDHVTGGVNTKIAEKLGLQNPQILAPKTQVLTKLAFFVPVADTERVLNALFKAGAGRIGNYEQVSFRAEGIGAFTPTPGANPAIGQVGQAETVTEHRAEVLLPSHLEPRIVAALKQAHPYEEVAYDLYPLKNTNADVGAGMIGTLPQPLAETDWLAYLKQQMALTVIRHTPLRGQLVQRVAVCGGAGGFLLNDAIRAGADAFVTADYKYHEFFDADGRIVICDIGHYESEVFTKALLQQHLAQKFLTFAIFLSETDTNPVRYFFQ
jgi:dinuclear metal center YbgI/SA1388 family protein